MEIVEGMEMEENNQAIEELKEMLAGNGDVAEAEEEEEEEEEDNSIVICDNCDAEIDKDDSYQVNDNTVCQDCYDQYGTCDHCESMELYDDMIRLEDSRGNDISYCQDCFDSYGFSCNDCGDNHLNRDRIETSRGNSICQSCYEDSYFSCESCNEVYHQDYMCSNDYGCYCESCYREDEEEEDNSNVIHGYHYKPRAVFHRIAKEEKLYMGLEWEVDGGNNDYAEDLIELSNSENLFWLEHDSSLNNGFELVTHPCTLEYYMKQFPLEQISKGLIDNGFKSHNTDTCGLHIHVGKKLLTNTDQIKMGLFVGFNSDKLKVLGRRDYNHYCHKKEIEKGNLQAAKYSPSRYEAINFTNDNTVEFRFFKGTLKYSTILASIQFVHSLVKFCKGNGFPTIIKPCWNEYCDFIRGKKEYLTLITYLEFKGIMGNFNLTNPEKEGEI